MKVFRASFVACCLIGTCSFGCFGQSFPSKTVRVIVPFPPGGQSDIFARLLASQLQPRWAVPVLVENRPGAGGIVGSEQVAHAAGDPHLLLLTATFHVINPGLYRSLPYDARRDFTSLALVALMPGVVLVVNPAFPARTVADLIKLAKEAPGSIGFASTGTGGTNHLAGELLKIMAKIDMVHVPYKGEAPALNDVLAGHVPVMFAGLNNAMPNLVSGKLRALAVTSLVRIPSLPSVPTLDEAGVKGFGVSSWFGLFGPARMPAAAVTRIAADMGTLLGSEAIKTHFDKMGVEPGAMSQPEFAHYVESEMDKWSRVIEQAKIPKE